MWKTWDFLKFSWKSTENVPKIGLGGIDPVVPWENGGNHRIPHSLKPWGTLAPQEVGCEALSSILNACHEFNPILTWHNRMMTWKCWHGDQKLWKFWCSTPRFLDSPGTQKRFDNTDRCIFWWGIQIFNWFWHLSWSNIENFRFSEKSKNLDFRHVMKPNKTSRMSLHRCPWYILFDYFSVWTLPDMFFHDFSKNDPKNDPKIGLVWIFPVVPWKKHGHHRIPHSLKPFVQSSLFFWRPFWCHKNRVKGQKKLSQEDPLILPEGPPWDEMEGECFAPWRRGLRTIIDLNS